MNKHMHDRLNAMAVMTLKLRRIEKMVKELLLELDLEAEKELKEESNGVTKVDI